MIVGPRYKVCKRLGNGVYEKCQTQKFALSEARGGTRGRGGRRPRMMSDYGKQLLEKQKVRFTYGVTEKQLVKYVRNASESKGSDVTTKILQTLEQRLDNVVYRIGLAPTRRAARQMVSHGHVTVNGKKVSIPSYNVSVGEKVSVREASKKKELFANVADYASENKVPAWLVFDVKKLEGSVKGEPTKENTDAMFDLTVVMEFYSR